MVELNELDPRVVLDLAVARAVFGWEEVTEDEEQPEQVPYYVNPDPESRGILYPKVAAKFPNVYPPVGGLQPYSTDMAAAWLVVERLRQFGRQVRIESRFGFTSWDCQVYRGERSVICEGATAAEAICRAALAWAEQRIAGARAAAGQVPIYPQPVARRNHDR